MDFKHIQHLLIHISEINKKYKKIAEITGENFNIFEILKLSQSEVRLHTALIGALINPEGSHNQKDVFLNKFILKLKEHQLLNDNFKIDTSKAKVETEKYIGNLTDRSGGRIDIFINDCNYAIIIENKIYAKDQKNQLVRYYNYGKEKGLTMELFYLNLNNAPPNCHSRGELEQDKDFKIISYKDIILPWLLDCLKDSVTRPTLRETIIQYINQIKYLTGQTRNSEMKTEIINEITQDKKLLSAFFLLQRSDVLYAIRSKVIDTFKSQLKQIEIDKGFSSIIPEHLGIEKDTDIEFYLPESFSKNEFYFDFGFVGTVNQFLYGICCKKDIENHDREKIVNKMNIIDKRLAGYPNWIWVASFEKPFDDWSKNSEPWLAIIDGTLEKNIRGKIDKMTEYLKEVLVEL